MAAFLSKEPIKASEHPVKTGMQQELPKEIESQIIVISAISQKIRLIIRLEIKDQTRTKKKLENLGSDQDETN